METFELDVVVRKKLIQLRGNATPKEAPLVEFLRAHSKPKDTLLICLAEWMQYQGCELEESMLFTLFILAAETYNLLYACTAISYPISIMIIATYTLIFTCFASYKFQMLLQVFFLVAATAVLGISMSMDFVDQYIMLAVTASVAMVLVARLIVYIQDYILLESPSSGFTLESNLIILLYSGWKAYECLITGSYSGLFPAFIALCLMNTVKIYVLFSYNILHSISIFCEQANQSLLESSQTTPQLTQSIAIFVQTKNDQSDIELNKEKDSIIESKVQGNEEQTVQDAATTTMSLHKTYDSQKRFGVSIIMMLIFTGQIVYVAINITSSNTSTILPPFFASACQFSFLLVMCECQKIMKGYQKQWLIMGYIYMMDVLMVGVAAVVSYFQSYLGLNFQTAIFYSVFPLLVVKIFNDINEQVHSQLDNGRYYIFFAITLAPFCLRSIVLYHGITVGTYFIDALIYLYAVVVVTIWSNRSQMLAVYQQIRSVLTVKKRKIKFFDKLKQLKANYPNLVQNFVFVHVILLSALYSLTVFTSIDDQISYFIFYFAPILLYLACLHSNYTLSQTKPESYSPSKLTVAMLLLSVGYAVVSQIGILQGDHETWSLEALMNVFLFSVLREGQRVALVYLQSYSCFIRVLLVSVFFVFIYLPFVSVFISGYYWSSFSQDFFYYFMLAGFFYLWLLITIAGTAIHLVLNLTEKSKKDLFIAQYMENEMRKIGLKENIQKFLMISNEYELLNHKSEDLLKYLKDEKHMMVVVRREKDIPHDYQLVEPDDNLVAQRIAIVAKPINPLDAVHRIVHMKTDAQLPQQQQKQKENPVLAFLREKQKARIEVTRAADLNRNVLQLKRMAQRTLRMPNDLKEIEHSQQFRSMKAAPSQKCSQLIARLYNFLSQPGDCVSRETFGHLLRLLTRQQLSPEETDKVYVRFSESGLINEYRFKKFLVDYVQFKYDMQQGRLCDLLRTFCCYELAPLFQARFTVLDYHLRRKQLQLTQESRDIWLRDGGSDQDDEMFREVKAREAKKKEKLLMMQVQDTHHAHAHLQQEEEEQSSASQEEEHKQKGMIGKRRTLRKQLKDKTFLRPENIYAMLVNALIECYLFYEKEADSFKIKSIKLSVSNILALATKASDICLVFGYPTIYLLVAQFQEDYTSPGYALGSVSYPILLTLAGASTLLYIGLILYHKRDFQMGSLGLDEQHRSLGICSLKFFTTQLLFLLGSALANYIISIGLNSLICDRSTGLLFNFSNETCYGEKQFVYMFVALLILAVYWPLSAITFPFSTAMDRQLQIKYKSEFEIVYLQFKFLINGFNTLLNPYDFQTEQFIVSLLKVLVCLALAVLYGKMQPCSYQLLNRFQGKIYVLLTILSFAGALCYFVGLLKSLMITGGFIVLYLVYFVYATVKNVQKMKQDEQQDDIVLDNIRNQQIKIKVIRQNADPENNPKLQDDHISEVKLNEFPSQDIKNTQPFVSKQTFKFW